MTAYYNEIEPYAAAWLRNLIAEGLIAPGDVDERDIRDVRPDELGGYTQCHFFAGVGVWSHALRLAGWPDDRPVWTGSCPCQPFSAAGRGAGFADERHLWPHWHHLVSQCRPPVVFGEQVASKDGLGWLDLVQADMEGSSYAFGAVDLCAAGVGAPHIRQRLWFVGEDRLADADQIKRRRWADSEGLFADWPTFGRQQGDGKPEPDRAIGGLAHSSGDRSRAGLCHSGSPEQRRLIASDDGAAYRVGDASGLGRQGREPVQGPEARSVDAGTGAACGVGDAHHQGLPVRECEAILGAGRREEGRAIVQSGGSLGRLGDAQLLGRDQGEPGDERGQEGARGEPRHVAFGSSLDRWPGPTNGFWRDADWLLCRDGKWRPIEPGSFPLAHGAAARVGRLRAYGNAISPYPAAEIIGSYLDIERLRLTGLSEMAYDSAAHDGVFA